MKGVILMGILNKINLTINTIKKAHDSVQAVSKTITTRTDERTKIDDNFAITLKHCKKLHTDLVECPKNKTSCPICSKYQDRVYSISGKDKRFPKLPKEVFIYGGFHEGCSHCFYPFTFGVSKMASGKKDVIKWSNRPFK